MFSGIYIWNCWIAHTLISRMTNVLLKLKFICCSFETLFDFFIARPPLSLLSTRTLSVRPPWWSSDLDLINTLCGLSSLSEVVCYKYNESHNLFIQRSWRFPAGSFGKADYNVSRNTEEIPLHFTFKRK